MAAAVAGVQASLKQTRHPLWAPAAALFGLWHLLDRHPFIIELHMFRELVCQQHPLPVPIELERCMHSSSIRQLCCPLCAGPGSRGFTARAADHSPAALDGAADELRPACHRGGLL